MRTKVELPDGLWAWATVTHFLPEQQPYPINGPVLSYASMDPGNAEELEFELTDEAGNDCFDEEDYKYVRDQVSDYMNMPYDPYE